MPSRPSLRACRITYAAYVLGLSPPRPARHFGGDLQAIFSVLALGCPYPYADLFNDIKHARKYLTVQLLVMVKDDIAVLIISKWGTCFPTTAHLPLLGRWIFRSF